MFAAPSPSLPDALSDYRPAGLPNGCMVEAVAFADWFMSSGIDGPASWAQAVFIEPRFRGRKIAHAVALFRYRGKFHLWDVEWGCLELPVPQPTDGSLAQLAERVYAAHLDAAASRYQATGQLPPSTTIEPRLPSAAILCAINRLSSTRPTVLVQLHGPAQAGDAVALAFIVQDRLLVYHPSHGTAAAPMRGAAELEAEAKRIARAWGYSSAQLRRDTMTIPAPEPVRRAEVRYAERP